jgi:hypothetical protein
MSEIEYVDPELGTLMACFVSPTSVVATPFLAKLVDHRSYFLLVLSFMKIKVHLNLR